MKYRKKPIVVEAGKLIPAEFTYEDIKDTQLARMADYIVDGKFEQDKKITGKMYGSSNQRIIDIKNGGLYYE